jgi:hypothetical protein
MDGRRWINNGQPQTLQIAVFLLYINAFFLAVQSGLGSPLVLLLVAGGAGAGFGIANEKKWGYALGVVMAFLPFAYRWQQNGIANVLGRDLISTMFEIALVALLLHPQSRDYERIWFK